jgi:transposase
MDGEPERKRSGRIDVRTERWVPPRLSAAQEAALKEAVQGTPDAVGVAQAKWTWKAVRQYLKDKFECSLSGSSCLNYLHRLGFVLKRPKKRLTKANPEKRATFVEEYVTLREEAKKQGARIFFADEAHFRADVQLQGQWVQRGQPALVDSSSPMMGEKASYYSGVCLETGEVHAMVVDGNTNAATTVEFLKSLREKFTGPLIVIWDNGPAHRGETIRTYLSMPGLQLRLVALPPYSPDFNPDEAIWQWIRAEVTANTCFGTAEKVREKVDAFFVTLVHRVAEVKHRCQRELQALADRLLVEIRPKLEAGQNVVLTLGSV